MQDSPDSYPKLPTLSSLLGTTSSSSVRIIHTRLETSKADLLCRPQGYRMDPLVLLRVAPDSSSFVVQSSVACHGLIVNWGMEKKV